MKEKKKKTTNQTTTTSKQATSELKVSSLETLHQMERKGESHTEGRGIETTFVHSEVKQKSRHPHILKQPEMKGIHHHQTSPIETVKGVLPQQWKAAIHPGGVSACES